MLKELTIGDNIFLYECLVNGDVIEYNLFESDESWIAVKTPAEVAQTLQLLNKRIKYNLDTAYDTLQYAHPESANWAERDEQASVGGGQSAALERVLKLKYHIKGRPFHFEWHLKKQDNSLSIQLPFKQVVCLVEVLPKQIEELLDVLRRKEDEILQYRREFGSLRRSTLATKAFDVAEFREQYASTDLKVKRLQKIIARWRAVNAPDDTEIEPAQDKIEASTSNNSSPKTACKKEESEISSPSTSKNVQESPRNRKRKAMQAHKAQLTRTLKTRRTKLEYESQSQSLSENEQMHDNNIVATEALTYGTDTVDAIHDVFENAIGALEAIEEANERENDVAKIKLTQVLNGQADKPSTSKAARAAINMISKEATKEPAKEAVNGQADSPSTSKAARAALSRFSKDTTKEPVKEIVNGEVDRPSTSKAARAALSRISKDATKDSAKETVNGQADIPSTSKAARAALSTIRKDTTKEPVKEAVNGLADIPSTSKAARAALSPIIKDVKKEPVKENASKIKRTSPRLAAKQNTPQNLRQCATPENNSSDIILIENPNENVVYNVDESVEPVGITDAWSFINAEPTQIENSKCTMPIVNTKCKVEQPRNDISSYVDSVLSQLDAFDKELRAQFG